MSEYNIRLTKQAIKTLDSVDRPTQQRIKAAIQDLPQGDTKVLKGYKGAYRLRVGDWRIIYTCSEDKTIVINKIAPRGDVYKGV